MPGEIISERRARSNRNGGRYHRGFAGDFPRIRILVQRRRDKRAAKRLLRKLLKKQMRPARVMITDKLASYGAAKREVMPGIEHRQRKALNNRAENSHQPTCRRERQMKQFKSAGQAQRFLLAHDQINNIFHLRRDHVTAAEHRARRSQTFRVWAEISSMGWH